MEIQLYKALTAAGIPDQTALDLTEAIERDIKERMTDARKELATARDLKETELRLVASLAEAKAEIIKWNVGAIIAPTGLAVAVAKMI